MALDYAVQNVRVNGWFFVRDQRFPRALTPLALAGLIGFRGQAGRAAMLLYFALFFGITLFFYAGSYDYGADVRYSLSVYPPVMMLAGLGTAWLVRSFERTTVSIAASLVLATAAVGQFAWVYLPVVRAETDSAWAARADVDFARGFVPRLPRGAYVLTHNPGMFQVWGVNAGQMSFATAPGFLDDLFKKSPGGVYLHWNFWCNTDDPVHRALCTKVRDLGSVELAGDLRVRDQRFVFYRMNVAKSGPSGP
jgi:hypothetical protein